MTRPIRQWHLNPRLVAFLAALALALVVPALGRAPAAEAAGTYRLQVRIVEIHVHEDWDDGLCLFCEDWGELYYFVDVVQDCRATATGRPEIRLANWESGEILSSEGIVHINRTLPAFEISAPSALCIQGRFYEDDWPLAIGGHTRLTPHTFTEGDRWGAGRHSLIGGRQEVVFEIQILAAPPVAEQPVFIPAPVVYPGEIPVLLRPDLRVVDLRVGRQRDGSGGCRGDAFNYVVARVRNEGTDNAGAFSVRLQGGGGSEEVPVEEGLAPGEERPVTVRLRLPAGTVRVGAMADSGNTVRESDERDNLHERLIACGR